MTYAPYRKLEGDQELAADMIEALASLPIDDITYEQMSRIARRIHRLSGPERNVPKRVADILAEELSPQKALQYVDKAFAAGMIKAREYDKMRAALILPLPRKEIPPPLVPRMASELLEGQRRIREDFRKLSGTSQQALRKPFQVLDEDVKRIRKAWRL